MMSPQEIQDVNKLKIALLQMKKITQDHVQVLRDMNSENNLLTQIADYAREMCMAQEQAEALVCRVKVMDALDALKAFYDKTPDPTADETIDMKPKLVSAEGLAPGEGCDQPGHLYVPGQPCRICPMDK